MRISKARGRDSLLSTWRQVLRWLSITFLLLIVAHLSSVQMIPIYYDQENLKLRDRDSVENQSSQTRASESKQIRVPRSTKLRLDWTNHQLSSPMAQRIQQHENDCSLPLGNFKFRNRFGLGSDLHVWSLALCNAMHYKVRIRTVWDWLWVDAQSCQSALVHNSTTTFGSPFQCYFPNAELQCPNDLQMVKDHPTFDEAFFNISGGRRQGTVNWNCPSILTNENMQGKLDFQEAAMEFLFGQISPLVMQEAKRQHALVFGGLPTPDNLITVHIRWGDKKREMKLLKMQQYLDAIEQLLQEAPRPTVHIFLATEDPEAVEQFRQLAPVEWKIYIDQFYTELLPYRQDEYNGIPKAATMVQRMGTIALGSMLVALEANDFVLTTESNWSRLMNELRKRIVDRSCNGCTKMVDLKPLKSL